MAMRPQGSVGGCVAALVDGKVGMVGALGRQNWKLGWS